MKIFLQTIATIFCLNIAFAQLPVSTEPQLRNVILEEFTGIYCSFCPDGHRIANELVDSNPNRVFPINIHTGTFAAPNSFGDPDFRTIFGDSIGYLCNVGSYPSAIINRSLLPGLGSGNPTVVDRNSWGYALNPMLLDTSYVNIAMEATVNVITRKLDIEVEMFFTGTAPSDVNFNIALLQNNISGPQVNGLHFNPDQVAFDGSYLHQHALRHLITGQWGEVIDTTSVGTLITRTYSYTVPANYNSIDCSLGDIELVGFIADGKKNIVTGAKSILTFEGLQTNDASLLNIYHNETYCGNEVNNISLFFKNEGGNTIETLKFKYNISGQPAQFYTWYGTLEYNQEDSIVLQNIDVAGLTNSSLIIEVDEVNGLTDPSTVGNVKSTDLQHTNNHIEGNQFTFYIIQDQLGNETTWEIIDNTTGGIINIGGPYAIIPNGAPLDTHQVTVNITNEGCHTINIYDEGHNGINGPAVGEGKYWMETPNGTTFLSSDGIFMSKQTKYFYIDALAVNTTEYEQSLKIQVYPNPVHKEFVIHSDVQGLSNIKITDILGKTIYSQNDVNLNHSPTFQTHGMKPGIYLVHVHNNDSWAVQKIIVR
ncbi:MAG: Omp28-related outer membrane protein [Flavobacteriales bacterium]